MINQDQESKNVTYLMVNQNWDDLGDPVNSLVDVNPDQDDFGQVNGNRLLSLNQKSTEFQIPFSEFRIPCTPVRLDA